MRSDARRVERGACNGGRGACREAGERVRGGSDGMHARGPTQGLGAKGTRGAHSEHGVHGRDAGRVPVGNVRVEVLQVVEEVAHVGDGRDIPESDGAVRLHGGSRVGVERLERNLQGGLGRECGRAASRPPARFIIASGGEGRGARPRATDEQLVGIGQGCALPRVARGGAYDVGGEVRAGRRGGVSEPAANGEHGTGPD